MLSYTGALTVTVMLMSGPSMMLLFSPDLYQRIVKDGIPLAVQEILAFLPT